MASYAMCHLKLDMVLTELGYTIKLPPRQSVWPTPEEGDPPQYEPFCRWLANEVKQANIISDMPTCVRQSATGISRTR